MSDDGQRIRELTDRYNDLQAISKELGVPDPELEQIDAELAGIAERLSKTPPDLPYLRALMNIAQEGHS